MTSVEEKIKSLSIEERAVQREKQIISHTVEHEDIEHVS